MPRKRGQAWAVRLGLLEEEIRGPVTLQLFLQLWFGRYGFHAELGMAPSVLKPEISKFGLISTVVPATLAIECIMPNHGRQHQRFQRKLQVAAILALIYFLSMPG